jgi:hypothetical protein
MMRSDRKLGKVRMSLGKTFSLLFLFLFLTSCGKGDGGSSTALASESMALVDTEKATPTQAATWDVNVKMNNFDRDQEEKIQKTIDLIRKVVASDAFRKRILNYTYKGKKAFFDNDGLSNSQIYKKILEGSETVLSLGSNNTMDLDLELYTDADAVTIGYTMPNIVKVFMNTKYFNKFQPFQVADNMFHEWLHKLGFNHSVAVTPDRAHSVPYAVGYIVKALAQQME